ncbi:MAG: S66 peptidase family protein [Candidatus Acidiferrales bacterium]
MAKPLKPLALRPGDAVGILSLSSPVERDRLERGCEELTRMGYVPKFDRAKLLARDGFFAGSVAERLRTLKDALVDPSTRAIFGSRGGYGSNYLLDEIAIELSRPKILAGYSDLTSLQIFLWEKFGWVTFYGPMVAAGLERGADAPQGYDRESLVRALTGTKKGWSVDLRAESLVPGSAEGTLLGGCLTLVETTLGTPWELDTRDSILALEDRGMKPWQVDRALMHLKQAGKFQKVAGIILGDFPECEPPAGSESVRDVARRILAPLGVPVVWGAPIGHTARPMLTLPLGIRARFSAAGGADAAAQLEILEPAVA